MNRNDDRLAQPDRPISEGPPAERDDPAAWEMIEPGRYQPRRICGSNPGRELG